MYKMIVVDDESWIRERLIHTIDWDELGIKVIGEASDGEEALKISKELLPDIILTDIRMPVFDGLEFTKRLKESNITAKVVIISGYNDFEYARKAIKLGAFDYILKPVEDSDLINVIERCLEQINLEKRKEVLFKKADRQIKESQPVLKEKFFSNLVNGYFKNEKDIVAELEYFGIKNNNLNHICFIIQIDDFEAVTQEKKPDNLLIQFVLCNITKDFNNRLGENELFFSHSGEVVCIISSANEEAVLTRQIMSISNGIRKMVKKVLEYTVTIGIGETYTNIFSISESYRQAKQALLHKAYLGKDRIYDIRSIDIQHMPVFYKLYDTETLVNNIKTGKKEHALANLDTIIKDVSSSNNNIRPVDLKFIYIDIVNSIFKTSIEGKSSNEDFSDFSFNFFEQLNKIQTINEIHVWLSDTIIRIIDYLEKSQSSKKRKIVNKAVEYIENHYEEPMALNDVAEKMFLNASYFCKIFKDEIGESFTRYLMKLRVQKAIKLMNDPTLKIYEIAQKVGYDDVQYFTKIFKSLQGISPMQYREKIK